MKKTKGVFDLQIESTCPYCNENNISSYDDIINSAEIQLDKNKFEKMDPIENILKGCYRMYMMGEYVITETVISCRHCNMKYSINKLEEK